MPPKFTLQDFVSRSKAIHGDKYDYSPSIYLGAHQKLLIKCPLHGDFPQLPLNHLKGVGCPTCGVDIRKGVRFNTEEFILKARQAHGDKYDYSKAEYTGYAVKINIVCPEHGLFSQRANNHLAGIGCSKCGRGETRGKLLGQYSFTKSKLQPTNDPPLQKNKRKFLCTCGRQTTQPAYSVAEGKIQTCGKCTRLPKNHWETQTWVKLKINKNQPLPDEWAPKTHSIFEFNCECGKLSSACMADVTGGHTMSCGCRIPGKGEGSPARQIENYLTEIGVKFESDTRAIISPLELDIWVSEKRYAIEFNGTYYHSLDGTNSSPKTKTYHYNKFNLCRKQGITLMQIDEHEWNNPVSREVWKSVIASKLGLHKRVYARNTEFRKISKAEAENFLAKNHLQGDTPNANAHWCFGLFLDNDLCGVMTFTKHEKKYLNLTRLAFPLGVTVVGGAQKLFKNALLYLPPLDIFTFSNNRYSTGKVYETLGFQKDKSLPPSYQWYFQGRIWDKRQLRRKYLPKILSHFDPALTEHQNLYQNGGRCLYDAGYERWVYCLDRSVSIDPYLAWA